MNEDQLRALEKTFTKRMHTIEQRDGADLYWARIRINPPILTELLRFDPVLTEADVTFLRTNGIAPW